MQLNDLAVSCLLGLSEILGVPSTPSEGAGDWTVIKPWTAEADVSTLTAESTTIARKCAESPGSVVFFPQVIHGAHEVFVDGRLIESFGDPKFEHMRSFYGSPAVPCKEFAQASVVTWRVYSYTRYFARFSAFPAIARHWPYANFFSEAMNLFAAGGLVVISIYALTIFYGRVRRDLVFSVALAGLLFSLYFALSVASLFEIDISMLTGHRWADLGVLGGFGLFFNGLRLGAIIPKRVFQGYLAVLGSGAAVICFAKGGDSIQLGTSLAFGPTIGVSVLGVWMQLIEAMKRGFVRQGVFTLMSLGLISFGFVNEILAVTGLSRTYTVGNLCCVFGFLFFAFTVNELISQTYRERDYLRKHLEDEVERKTAELKSALHQLQSTQAELVSSAKLASLGTLSAGIAHEINNSLNFVYGAIKPLERSLGEVDLGTKREKVDKLFKVVNEGLTLTFAIIKSLRNYTGLNQAKFNDLRLKEVLDNVLMIIRSRLREVKVNVEIPEDLSVFGSVVGINQVFMNLISNSVDAMNGSGEITISATASDESILVKVKDNGCGISADVKKRMFDPFFTTKEVGKGTGLGLHIVRSEMERHQGKISVESEVGHGTTFILSLPKVAKVGTGVAA